MSQLYIIPLEDYIEWFPNCGIYCEVLRQPGMNRLEERGASTHVYITGGKT